MDNKGQSTAIPVFGEPAVGFDPLRGGVACAILLVIFVTLTPFSDLESTDALNPSSGNEVLTYFTLFFFAGLAVLLLFRTGDLPFLPFPSLASRVNLALLGWLVAVAVGMSVNPPTSGRRLALCFATFLLAAMLPWLTNGLRHFVNLILFVAAVVLVLCYLGIVLAPDLTIHQSADFGEPELAGAWRGIYGHKNIAASVMAVFIFVGWFAARMGIRFIGSLIALAAFVFLIFSGGKSALGMVFIVGIIAFMTDHVSTLWRKALVALGPLALLNFLTVGSTASETAQAVIHMLPIDPTFTGRTDIWAFALESMGEHPWIGRGFEAFWYSDALRYGVEDSSLWMASVATSHNSYIDLALTIGLPGLVLVGFAFIVGPLRDFHRTLPTRENRELARFFLVLWLFALYLGTFEAFFLSRAQPMWFVLALAVCGLRYTALFKAKE